jgi:hypothetical protein
LLLFGLLWWHFLKREAASAVFYAAIDSGIADRNDQTLKGRVATVKPRDSRANRL